MSTPSRKVIVYRKDILRISETFIKAQVQSYQNWHAVLWGERLWPNGLSLDDIEFKTLLPEFPNFGTRLLAKARQITGFVPSSILNKLALEQADLLHVHFGHDAILAWPYAQKLKIPMIVTLHGHDVNISPWAYHAGVQGLQMCLYPYLFNRLVRQPNIHFLAVSNALRKTAIQTYNIPPSRITTHYTGIDTSKFTLSPIPLNIRPRRILFIGRLVTIKGCAYLIHAFEDVTKRFPDAELVIIGDGPEKQNLENLARTKNLAIKFTGPQNFDQIKEHFSKTRVFCLPSITSPDESYEAFGMVILEAMASGVPVITSARGGKEAIVHGTTGFTFDEKNTNQLAEHICTLLGNDDLAAQMASTSLNHVQQNFDIRQCTKQLESFYETRLSHKLDSGKHP